MVGGYEHDLLVTGDPGPDDEADRVRCLVVRGSLLRAGKAVEVRPRRWLGLAMGVFFVNVCFWFPLKGGIGGIVHPPIGRKNATYIGFCSTVSVVRFFRWSLEYVSGQIIATSAKVDPNWWVS